MRSCIIAVVVAMGVAGRAARAQSQALSGALSVNTGADRVRADAQLQSPTWKGFHIAFSPRYGTDRSAPRALGTEQALRATLFGRFGNAGLWVGTRNVSGFSAGAWRGFGNAVVSVSAHDRSMRVVGRDIAYQQVTMPESVYTDTSGWQHFQVTRVVSDSSQSSQMRRWSELEARIDWSPWGARGVRFAGALSSARPSWGPRSDTSLALRAPSRYWGRISADIPRGAHFGLIASAGTEPSIRDGARAARFMTVGLRWNPFAARATRPERRNDADAGDFGVARAADGSYVVSVRAAHAHRVEITGDFADWKPLPLRETSAGVWQTTLSLRPGTYRVNSRVDGAAWDVPRGLASVTDEFNGRVGIFVVR